MVIFRIECFVSRIPVKLPPKWARFLMLGPVASLDGIAGSNPAEGMTVSLLCVVCCQVEFSASG
jgi:hypothetical protein